MKFLKLKRFWLGLFCLLIFGFLPSCAGTRTLLSAAPNAPQGLAAHPALKISSITVWEEQKPSLQTHFEREVYGVMPRGNRGETVPLITKAYPPPPSIF